MPDIVRYAGFGEEAVFGTPVPAAFHVDIQSAGLDSPTDAENLFEGGLGRAYRFRKPGYYRPGGNIVYAWDVRTIASLLRWTLGGYVFTEDSPLSTHEVWGSNEILLPSFTSRIGKDVFEHVFAGCIVESLELDLGGDFLLATMVVAARRDEKAILQEPDALLLPDEFPLAFHEVTMDLPASDSTDISPVVKALTLTINNGSTPDAGRSIGSRYPRRLPVRARSVSLTADLWYESTDHLETYWGASDGPSDDGSASFDAKIVADAGEDGSLVLDFPNAYFSQVAQAGSGRDEIVQSVAATALEGEIELIDSTSVLTEILATVSNAGGDLEGSS